MCNHPLNADIHNFRFSLVFRASWHPGFDSSSFLIDYIVMKGRGRVEEGSRKKKKAQNLLPGIKYVSIYSNETFLLFKLHLSLVVGFTLEWGYHTHMSHWSPSQQLGWVYFGRLETMSVVPFLFKAAFGTLAECLMVCVQRKGTCHELEKYFFKLRYVDVDLYVCIYTCYLYVYVFIYTCYIYIYVYVCTLTHFRSYWTSKFTSFFS